ncbi:Thiol-disulfide oxidoreductase ResA [Planctomycetes bacterium CA13]|uniref:Thiol-disulfide oxidoreductase ResA n=1 Tax=Novipirellula herctigrandis TaxID=2527986 RepID=A0A5C5YZW6_9BACT|nr:Thiol-disulfide oxidoreductase ResA [Planctomycetes bacterium CA13]
MNKYKSVFLVLMLLFLPLIICAVGEKNAYAQTAFPTLPPVLLQMIRDDTVHQDLGISESQIQEIRGVLVDVDGPWFRARIQPAKEQQEIINAMTTQLQTRLKTILTPEQQTRLTQLQRQALGSRMVLRNDLRDTLEISDSQLTEFVESFKETDKRSNELQQSLSKGELTADEVQKELGELQANERQSFVDVLTTKQRSSIGALTGKPFSFASVQRTYPLAPELVDDGVTWIQGTPVKLADLRGKVVALHFYAFQCINCRRNLPHYSAWHTDYADKGLVVIGIQRPETSTERDISAVRAAAKKEGIEYPVLMDLESSNWDAWGNTMWPTVYLIDKKGFIRRWWQGEMNWQGTEGEKDMRQSVEQLLGS